MKYLLAGLALALLSTAAAAQQVFYNSHLQLEPAMITSPPDLGELKVKMPDAVMKDGIEGTVTVTFTLGGDGHVHDAKIVDDLPSGVGEAVRKAVENWTFTPASFQ